MGALFCSPDLTVGTLGGEGFVRRGAQLSKASVNALFLAWVFVFEETVHVAIGTCSVV